MICQKADLTVASGCALANIPMIIVSSDEFESIENGKELEVDTGSSNVLN
jgi:predicted aconitase with swiveling domain